MKFHLLSDNNNKKSAFSLFLLSSWMIVSLVSGQEFDSATTATSTITNIRGVGAGVGIGQQLGQKQGRTLTGIPDFLPNQCELVPRNDQTVPDCPNCQVPVGCVCNGSNHDGRCTQCVEGSGCVFFTEEESRCVEGEIYERVSNDCVVEDYEQCGGVGYSGCQNCKEGSVCMANSVGNLGDIGVGVGGNVNVDSSSPAMMMCKPTDYGQPTLSDEDMLTICHFVTGIDDDLDRTVTQFLNNGINNRGKVSMDIRRKISHVYASEEGKQRCEDLLAGNDDEKNEFQFVNTGFESLYKDELCKLVTTSIASGETFYDKKIRKCLCEESKKSPPFLHCAFQFEQAFFQNFNDSRRKLQTLQENHNNYLLLLQQQPQHGDGINTNMLWKGLRTTTTTISSSEHGGAQPLDMTEGGGVVIPFQEEDAYYTNDGRELLTRCTGTSSSNPFVALATEIYNVVEGDGCLDFNCEVPLGIIPLVLEIDGSGCLVDEAIIPTTFDRMLNHVNAKLSSQISISADVCLGGDPVFNVIRDALEFLNIDVCFIHGSLGYFNLMGEIEANASIQVGGGAFNPLKAWAEASFTTLISEAKRDELQVCTDGIASHPNLWTRTTDPTWVNFKSCRMCNVGAYYLQFEIGACAFGACETADFLVQDLKCPSS